MAVKSDANMDSVGSDYGIIQSELLGYWTLSIV